MLIVSYKSKVEMFQDVGISISKGRPASMEFVRQEEKVMFVFETFTPATITKHEEKLETTPETITRPGKKLRTNLETITEHEKKLRTTLSKNKLQVKIEETGNVNMNVLTINPLIPEFKSWKDNMTVFCNDSFFAFAGEFAFARDIILDPSRAEGLSGGEESNIVLNQKEDLEFYKFKKGFLFFHANQIIHLASKII